MSIYLNIEIFLRNLYSDQRMNSLMKYVDNDKKYKNWNWSSQFCFLLFDREELAWIRIIVFNHSLIYLLVDFFNFRFDMDIFRWRLIFIVRLLLFLLVNWAQFFVKGIVDCLWIKLFFNENNDDDIFVRIASFCISMGLIIFSLLVFNFPIVTKILHSIQHEI